MSTVEKTEKNGDNEQELESKGKTIALIPNRPSEEELEELTRKG